MPGVPCITHLTWMTPTPHFQVEAVWVDGWKCSEGCCSQKLLRSKAVLAPGLKLGLNLNSSALKSPVMPA